jgi:hypothetical protein
MTLTTEQLHRLDEACRPLCRTFGHPPYLVGSAFPAVPGDGTARDVDVRLMLDEDQFAEVCPTRDRWELLSMAITAYLRDRTGLPVDFQIQRADIANERFSGPRNPLGLGSRRIFAGGGDATPWDGTR